jgi:hypothetical protein
VKRDFLLFFTIYCPFIKAKWVLNTIIYVEDLFMRKRRALKQDVWYEIRTRVNNGEPLFGQHRAREKALAVFYRVFRLSRVKYAFDFRRLRLSGDLLTFYIKPEDGFQLPDIMQWLKQVFAVEFNKVDGRTGHIWGDRYWSRSLDGEPPEDDPEDATMGNAGARPPCGERAESPLFPAPVSPTTAQPPGSTRRVPRNRAALPPVRLKARPLHRRNPPAQVARGMGAGMR